MSKRGLAFAVIATLMLVPSVAAACPVCAADNGKGAFTVLAIFISVPFIIAIVVIPMIVRAVRQAGP
jgi:hypothetical protein